MIIRQPGQTVKFSTLFWIFGDTLVVFEHKGKYLELGAKYGGDRELFLADLKSEKRIGKGVHQLAENLELVFDNRPDANRRVFHERDGECAWSVGTVRNFPSAQRNKFYQRLITSSFM
jgi:hypothetical protein